jgi:hypothetical protein
MIIIKHIDSNITVTPMPSAQGRFGDPTLPNCPAEDCCLVMASRTTALRSKVSQPQLTEEECATSMDNILADKANWSEAEKAQCEVTQAEVEAKRDELRGYTEQDVEDYIKENSVEAVEADPANGVEAVEEVVVTDTEAREALHKKEMSMVTMSNAPVEVPDMETLELELIEEKEQALAKQKCDTLVQQGFLVTDLSATDEEGNEIWADWKAQFEVIDTPDI